jgi:hypothetical protein
MSQRVLIRHSTGSKAATVEEFPVLPAKELLFGRDTSCDIRFDQDRDEYVSRRHMKLVVGDPSRLEFTAVDLSALNGTFVNNRRVSGSTSLHAGDLVQLGAGGPQFTFDVVTDDLRVTPLSGIVPPRNAFPLDPPSAQASLPAASIPPKKDLPRPGAYARKSPRRNSPQRRVAGLVVLALVVVAVAGRFTNSPRMVLRRAEVAARAFVTRAANFLKSSRAPTPQEVASRKAEFLVTVETAWRLVDSAAGRPLKQIYIPNRQEQSDGSSAPLIPNAGPELPVFVLLEGNRLQPLLTVADRDSYPAIGGTARGAGFIVGPERLILTSRAVTSPWRAPYDWPPADTAGIVAVFDQHLKLSRTALIARRQFPRWLPVDTDFVLENALDSNSARVNSSTRGKGLSDSLNVHIATRRLDVRALLVKESEETGFSAIRLDGQMAPSGIAFAAGVTPAVGDACVLLASTDTPPAVGKLSAIDPDGRYDIAVDTVYAGDTGAPVFDRAGRLVAVQAAADPLHPDRAFAISIRRALESVGQAPAMHNAGSTH